MIRILSLFALIMLLAGCAMPQRVHTGDNHVTLKRRALRCLKAAIQYEHNPAVRVEAVEALESSSCEEGLPWIRAALLDGHPAVRFAACVALGRLEDGVVERRLRTCLTDEDDSVQVGALFALHRLGYSELTGRMPAYLLNGEDVTVRRNAALVLGLLNEPGTLKVLARAMRDRDAGVRQHALEGMARLGNREARQELSFMTNAGLGTEEAFAIQALSETGDPIFRDTLRYKLATAVHLETRLAAARGLGRLGSDEGFDVALAALKNRLRLVNDPNDTASGQILRARQMAAVALGAIGRPQALPALSKLMDDPADPRVQVSAARAVLEILAVNRADALPFVLTDHRSD